jgi:methionyl-tRNA formyltransferase
MNLRIVFMGSPEFALPALNALAENYRVEGVVTQPDRPAGRGRELTPPAVKILAQEHNLPIIQPAKLRELEAMEQLRSWNPEVIVVAAFGQILRSDVLDLPPHGCVNVHASLLPRWRGAAPIQAAILHGDDETGITIMKMDPGLDTGPILSQQAIPITPKDTAGRLSPRLAELGAQLLLKTLPGYVSGEIQPQPQDDSLATYAPMLKKSDGELDFFEPAEDLARRVRAFNPWPGTFFLWQGERLKVHQAHAVEAPTPRPGETVIYDDLPAAGTGDGLLVLEVVQPAGKKPMAGDVFLHGARGWGK